MAIVTLAAAKKQLHIDEDDTSQDVELQLYVDAATTAAEKARGEILDVRSFTDEFDLDQAMWFLLRSVPVIALISVVRVDGTQTWSVSPTVLHVNVRTGMVTVLSGPPVDGLVTVTYTAGRPAIEANYRVATLIILQHLWETQRGTMGVQLGGDGESFVPGRGFAVPHRAEELLGLTIPGVA